MHSINLIRISSFISQFVLGLSIVGTILSCIGAAYMYFWANNTDAALSIVGAGITLSLLLFLVYGKNSWTVYSNGDHIVCKKFGKRLEVQVGNIKRIEIFPDILFRGSMPQYEIVLKKTVQNVPSFRFYPSENGQAEKLLIDPFMEERRRCAFELRRTRKRR